MACLKTHRDVIFALGGPSNLARRLGIFRPSPPTLHWATRGIPPRYWHHVTALAGARGLDLTVHDLERMPRPCNEREPA